MCKYCQCIRCYGGFGNNNGEWIDGYHYCDNCAKEKNEQKEQSDSEEEVEEEEEEEEMEVIGLAAMGIA